MKVELLESTNHMLKTRYGGVAEWLSIRTYWCEMEVDKKLQQLQNSIFKTLFNKNIFGLQN